MGENNENTKLMYKILNKYVKQMHINTYVSDCT